MSSIIGVEGVSGTDLSSLTNGERFLIGWLGNPMRLHESTTYGIVLGGYMANTTSYDLQTKGILDLHTVASVTFRRYVYKGNQVEVSLRRTGALSSSGHLIGVVTFTKDDRDASVEKTMDISDASNRTSLWFNCHPYIDGIECTQFVTTDGKVHTASNLNY